MWRHGYANFFDHYDDLSDGEEVGCCEDCGEEEEEYVLERNDGLCENCAGPPRPPEIIQCRGITQRGARCQITSESVHSYQRKFADAAEPLAAGEHYCGFHQDQQYDHESEGEDFVCAECGDYFKWGEMDMDMEICEDCAIDQAAQKQEIAMRNAAAAAAAANAAATAAAAAATKAAEKAAKQAAEEARAQNLAEAAAVHAANIQASRASKRRCHRPLAAAPSADEEEVVVTASRSWAERDAKGRENAINLIDESPSSQRDARSRRGGQCKTAVACSTSSTASVSKAGQASRSVNVSVQNTSRQTSGDRKRKHPAEEEQPRRSARLRA